jgi:SAM-dependent methyltransferase
MNTRAGIAIGLISASLIGLEIVWTRILSAEYFHTFAFLIISLAILGMSFGALSLRLLRSANKDAFQGLFGSLAVLFAVGSPILVLALGLKFNELFSNRLNLLKLAGVILLLLAPFYFAGLVVARLLKQSGPGFHRIYAFDLVGASLGAVAAVVMMNLCGVPRSALLLVLPLVAGVLLLAGRLKYLSLVGFCGLAGLLVYLPQNLYLPKRTERAPIKYRFWDSMGLIKVYADSPAGYGINIDNAANTPVHKFDGVWNKPESEKIKFAINLRNFIEQRPDCRFLSVGAGGGGDVLQALQWGAKEVYAVEVMPRINHMLQKGELREFSGNIYNDPRVKVFTEDARLFVRNSRNRFDIIFSLSSNTFAALGSGAFAMAENYLFTKEAFRDYYRALSDHGYFIMEHQFYVPRLLSSAIQALKESGVDHPLDHIAVYNLPAMRRKMLVISKQPLERSFLDSAFVPLTTNNFDQIHLLYPCDGNLKTNLLNQIALTGWQQVQSRSPIDLSPTTDDRPFTAQLGLMKNVRTQDVSKLTGFEYNGFPIAKLIILAVLAITAVLALPVYFIPYAQNGSKLNLNALVYFSCLGAGFIAVEVVLIQQYTLTLGASAYSFAAVLLGLLVAGGVGSRLSRGVKPRIVFPMILLLIVLHVLVLRPCALACSSLPFPLRFLLTVGFTMPIGFFLGMPFALGARKVGELIDWGFAINGVASVVGSCLALLIAFNFGYTVALAFAAFLYFAAFVVYSRCGWTACPQHDSSVGTVTIEEGGC